jgi:hypothetical protein
MLSEVILIEKKGFFSKPKEVSHFTVYHECFSQDGKPAYQARQQSSASGSNDIVIAYLYGIINGSLAHLKRLPCPTSPTQNS